MRFRTELEITASSRLLALDGKYVSLGSCFSQAIGNRLCDGGVNISVTPMGILFNPLSIANIVNRQRNFDIKDLYCDDKGICHALDFESRRQNSECDSLLDSLNNDFNTFRQQLDAADCWLITFGTAWCFRHIPTDKVVGNCHKLPDKEFERRLCSVDEIITGWSSILEKAPRIIFTVSPVRHLNDGLHGNTLSKSRLHLAIEELCNRFDNAEYFPAFEALNDDLRDYRFYADDMKHPTTQAEEYIFELFAKTYFDTKSREVIESNRRNVRLRLHRPIIK